MRQVVPPWALALLCASKRLHSIFLLRLFNDGPAMSVAYIALAALAAARPVLAVTLFSAAVSVKMNVLLMAPPVLLVLLKVVERSRCHVCLARVLRISKMRLPSCTMDAPACYCIS